MRLRAEVVRFGENPRQCGKPAGGAKRFAQTRVSPKRLVCVSLILRKGFEVPR
jgi:hypothetical protein